MNKFKPKNKNCAWCSDKFVITEQLRSQDKYCCKDCALQAFKEKQQERYERLRKTEVKYKCKNCNKEFIANAYFKRIYCTKECQNRYASEKRKGTNNPNFQNGLYTHANFQNRKSKVAYKHLNECRRYKKEFVQKHGYQFCEVCKVNQNGTPKFEVHHIYFASRVPGHKYLHDNRNLIHICIECHRKFHAGKEYQKEFELLEKERGLKKLFS